MDARQQDSQPLEADSRVGKIIHWMVVNAARVCQPNKLRLTFHCAGDDVSVEMEERQVIKARV